MRRIHNPLIVLFATLSSLAHASAQSPDTAASVRWNALAVSLTNMASPLGAPLSRAVAPLGRNGQPLGSARLRDRVNPLVNLVTYLALEAAEKDQAKPSRRAATAAGAATVLRAFLPGIAADIDRELQRDIEVERRAGVSAARIDAGERLGRVIAQRTMKRAGAEKPDVPWTGTAPNGAGMWWSAPGVEPGLTARLSERPWALRSADQFRPKPPPAFGSASFDSALEEVRRVARERTAEQTRIAQRWGLEPAVDSWTRIITEILLRHRVDDLRAAHTLALVGIATYDAGIACTDAKYHYWLIRPTQADSTIGLADRVPLPNFPAFPSGHACLSGAIAETVAHFVPEVRAEVTRLAEEAALSRLYAGVHYRFDNDVGLELGRAVARYVIAEDSAGRLMARWR